MHHIYHEANSVTNALTNYGKEREMLGDASFQLSTVGYENGSTRENGDNEGISNKSYQFPYCSTGNQFIVLVT